MPTIHETEERVREQQARNALLGKKLRLLPCPFCGNYPGAAPWHGGAPSKVMVACRADDCTVNPQVSGETPKEAAAAWNRREPPATAAVSITDWLDG
jgi:hypothetical protein